MIRQKKGDSWDNARPSSDPFRNKMARMSHRFQSRRSQTRKLSQKQNSKATIFLHNKKEESLPRIKRSVTEDASEILRTNMSAPSNCSTLSLQKILNNNRSRDFNANITYLEQLRHKNQKLKNEMTTIEALMISINLYQTETCKTKQKKVNHPKTQHSATTNSKLKQSRIK